MDRTDQLVITDKNRPFILGYARSLIERGTHPDDAVRMALAAWVKEQDAELLAQDAIRRAECAEGMP